MMRQIVHRIPKLYSGGAEVVVSNIVEALPEINHVVAYSKYYDNWVTQKLKDRGNVLLVEASRETFPSVVRETDPEVIIYHFYPPFDAEDVTCLDYNLIERVVIYNHYFLPVPNIDGVHAYCFVSKNSMEIAGGFVPSTKSHLILNPVADEFFTVQHSKTKNVTIGRHSRPWVRKFPANFIALHESFDVPNLTVDVLGANEQIKESLAAVTPRHFYRLREFNSVSVLSFLCGIDIYLYNTDVSIVESGPMCILEAMAAGIPVITENRGAMPDLILNEQTGFLCADDMELKRSVERLYADPKLADDIAANGRAWAAQQCSLDVYRRGILSILTR